MNMAKLCWKEKIPIYWNIIRPKHLAAIYSNHPPLFYLKKQETQEEILKRYNITEREKQVIFLICQELRTSDIAKNLNLNERQVGTLRKSIMHKLVSLNAVGVAFFGIAAGIAALPEA